MPLNEQLVPVSFHLRNFNKYLKLDLQASQRGNLTLIGENAVGKTTLANCFFPMLIDGSIATPSFNAAKGTDRLDKAARNSAQDARNFDSMLLGWGPDAMKVRTGYSYIHFKSARRQAITGIGATRTTGNPSKPTWWFLIVNSDPQAALDVITTDHDGKCLDKSAFKQANAALGDQLQIFDTAAAYRDQVATVVYGFDGGQALSKLASAYRLLASPILTAGNAKFTPIIEALKNAQEGIDPQTIRRIADSQREVNYTNGLLERLGRVYKRLIKIRKDIFWGNLNFLDSQALTNYADTQQRLTKAQTTLDEAHREIEACDQQLVTIQASLKTASLQVDALREQQAVQKLIKTQRAQLQQTIASLNQRLATYQAQLQQLDDAKQQLADCVAKIEEIDHQRNGLKTSELSPLRAKLDQYSATLPELREVMTALELVDLTAQLQRYVRHQKGYQKQYQSLVDQINQGSQDVQIVGKMKGRMDQAIDQHAQGPLSGRLRDNLHQDNHQIHDDGASEMDQRIKQIIAQRDQLLTTHPDLKVILANESLLGDLEALQEQLQQIVTQLAAYDQDEQQVHQQQTAVKAQIDRLQALMEPAFDPAAIKRDITTSQQQLDELVIDPQLDQKVAQAVTHQQSYERTTRELETRKSKNQGKLDSAKVEVEDYQERLDDLTVRITQNLKVLQPYVPADEALDDVEDVLAFVHQNRSIVKDNAYADLVDKISKGIHRNGDDGVDHNAIDTVFEERGHGAEASQMRQQRSTRDHEMIVVAFDINHAIALIMTDQEHVTKKLAQLQQGNDVAQSTYIAAAVDRIDKQYKLIEQYNVMLSQGTQRAQSIKLKIRLTPTEVADVVIAEARNAFKEARPNLVAEVQRRLNLLANNTTLADDEEAFNAEAQKLLDTRQWSAFEVLIKRRQSRDDAYEVVDDKFVQSGGSGAEKAQAMVLPLLLVPKMVLQQSNLKDTPYLVMFDEFADKLDPETAKSFARTIANFGFNFIATMPSGAQNKILADGVDNIAYEVLAPAQQGDGRFHANRVRPALIWQKEAYDGSLS